MIDRIVSLIKELRPYEDILHETELIESGILDSLAVFNLVSLLEDEFDINIPDDAISAVNFKTVVLINNLITLEMNGDSTI